MVWLAVVLVTLAVFVFFAPFIYAGADGARGFLFILACWPAAVVLFVWAITELARAVH
jgi:hypothetical protein